VLTNDEIMKGESAKRYWKTHDYDLLQVKFCDDGKE